MILDRKPRETIGDNGTVLPDCYDAFWPRYLAEHRHPANRALHFGGTSLALLLLLVAALTGSPALVVAAIVIGYGMAWCGHFLIERNKPKSFSHPLWSLFSDLRMLALWLAGRLDDELQRLEID